MKYQGLGSGEKGKNSYMDQEKTGTQSNCEDGQQRRGCREIRIRKIGTGNSDNKISKSEEMDQIYVRLWKALKDSGENMAKWIRKKTWDKLKRVIQQLKRRAVAAVYLSAQAPHTSVFCTKQRKKIHCFPGQRSMNQFV